MLLRVLLFIICLILLIVPVVADCVDDLAEVNSTRVFTQYFKASLFSFLTNPNATQNNANVTELRETIRYFMRPGDKDNTDICAESTPIEIINTYNGINISKVVRQMIEKPVHNVIPRCNDGTHYGDCSNREPFFCYSGRLLPRCGGPDMDFDTAEDNCGCPDALPCYPTGRCTPGCAADNECNSYTVYDCMDDTTISAYINAERCIGGICTTQPSEIQNTSCLTNWFCQSGLSECVRCRNSGDCSGSSVIYTCIGEEINERTCGENCINPGTTTSYCEAGGGGCTDNVIEICDPGQCINGSDTCTECDEDADCDMFNHTYYCQDNNLFALDCVGVCVDDACQENCTDTLFENCSIMNMTCDADLSSCIEQMPDLIISEVLMLEPTTGLNLSHIAPDTPFCPIPIIENIGTANAVWPNIYYSLYPDNRVSQCVQFNINISPGEEVLCFYDINHTPCINFSYNAIFNWTMVIDDHYVNQAFDDLILESNEDNNDYNWSFNITQCPLCPVACTDSDVDGTHPNGRNYNVPGTTRAVDGSTHTDFCQDSSTLIEGVCQGDGSLYGENYMCPDVCAAGRCQIIG